MAAKISDQLQTILTTPALYLTVTNVELGQHEDNHEKTFGRLHPTTSREQAIVVIAHTWKQSRASQYVDKDEATQRYYAAARKRRKEQVLPHKAGLTSHYVRHHGCLRW